VAVGAAGFLWVALWFLFLRPRDLEQAPSKGFADLGDLGGFS